MTVNELIRILNRYKWAGYGDAEVSPGIRELTNADVWDQICRAGWTFDDILVEGVGVDRP